MEPLKEMFGKPYYKKLTTVFSSVYKPFQSDSFYKEVTADLESRSLNQRMRHTSQVLHQYLPENYNKTIGVMKEVIEQMPRGYTALVFPDYVSQFGQAHFNDSLEALHYFTSFGSSEFAIRTFLKNDLHNTLKVMQKWSVDENAHVRRLASEGSRPRLPWSFKLDAIIARPSLTFPILENLKVDDELYVRKSVANHLNDITKDAPDEVIKLVTAWDKSHAHTSWIVKRGCRSLLKQGDKKSMALFNLTKNVKVQVNNFKLDKKVVRLNDVLNFQLEVTSQKPTVQSLMIDYRIYYFKKSGVALPKVFKLKEIQLNAGETFVINKKQRFEDFTTRQLFSGKHAIEIVINGEVMARQEFEFKR